jgi:hypothetical protein
MNDKYRQGFKECIEGLYEDVNIISKAVLILQKKEKQSNQNLLIIFIVAIVVNLIISYSLFIK